jgi:hypothetical protein
MVGSTGAGGALSHLRGQYSVGSGVWAWVAPSVAALAEAAAGGPAVGATSLHAGALAGSGGIGSAGRGDVVTTVEAVRRRVCRARGLVCPEPDGACRRGSCSSRGRLSMSPRWTPTEQSAARVKLCVRLIRVVSPGSRATWCGGWWWFHRRLSKGFRCSALCPKYR